VEIVLRPLPPSPLPSLSPASLVTVTITHVIAVIITIAFVTVNRLPPSPLDVVACPPTLSSLPSLLPPLPLPILLPANLTHRCHRHHRHHCCRHHHCLFIACHPHITVNIALATLTLALFVTRQPRPVAITHIIAITVVIALVAVNCLPPSFPLLLPPKPLLSLSHSTLVANSIARFIPLTLFVTRHPYSHCHRLAALSLFIAPIAN